jgi:hypothetical protein
MSTLSSAAPCAIAKRGSGPASWIVSGRRPASASTPAGRGLSGVDKGDELFGDPPRAVEEDERTDSVAGRRTLEVAD